MRQVLQQQLVTLTNSHYARHWLEHGFDGEVLSASTGKGWKKGKIRLRLEFIPDEPEPEPEPTTPDSSALAPLREQLNFQQ